MSTDEFAEFNDGTEQHFTDYIDAHVHFWKYDRKRDGWMDSMKVLQQNYLPGHIELTLKRNGIDGVMAIQADQSEMETHFLVELAKTNQIIRGVVGWVDLRDPAVEKRLEYFSQYHAIRGYRHIVQGEPNDFLLGKDFQRGVSLLKQYDYTYDVLIYHHQLESALSFISRFPDQPFMIDHCAKPAIKKAEIDSWKKWMKEIAGHPNTFCKLSGLLTEANWSTWSPADFYPYLDVVFECFGIDRLVFGSDWPVILVAGMYVQWKSLLEKYMGQFSKDHKDKVFGLNAKNFYRL